MKIYHVTEILGKYSDFSKIPDKILAAACRRGSIVHAACAALAQGLYVPALPETYAGYVLSFRRWFESNVAEVIYIEHKMTDPVLGFTGRPDMAFILNGGSKVLTDLKTPAALVKVWGCQLAAYRFLFKVREQIEFDDTLSLRLKIDGGPALGKRYGGSYANDLGVFISALTAHRNLIG